ncbi:hypothetical protein Trco_001505 [Trichoderma cornu-damae]|uniref:Uncharacterized protein n=1 Tax=Trichoderma cornu-damae TaxID=654480 RepID=A0A9P8QU16_9HYPO|nr:hypothetical protein Trco_001505 [Trichoderma cornu-damae]
MAALQTEDSLPGGLRFLTLRHAYQVAQSRRANTSSQTILPSKSKAKQSIERIAQGAVDSTIDSTRPQGDVAATATTDGGLEENLQEGVESGLEPLEDGHQKLYSYFPPRLDGGEQEITVTQNISTKPEPDGRPRQSLKSKITRKSIIVEAPQFSLPEGCVHSVNPPPGGTATAETLPHMVFTDPHLPWERRIKNQDDPTRRERVPWLALLVFDQEELRIPDENLQGDSSLFRDTSLAKDSQGKPTEICQSPVFTLPLTGSDVQALRSQGSIASPIPKADTNDPETRTTAIFLQPALFTKLVTTYEKQSKATGDGAQIFTVVSPRKEQTTADTSRFRHFAHVRHVKTGGMAASALYTEGLFSVILSHRVGPLSKDHKTPTVAHLVSLEGWDDMTLPISSSVRFVAISSLYSWTYTTIPTSGYTSLEEEIRRLEDNIDVLRAPSSTIESMKKRQNNPKLSSKLAKRISDGYMMQRHRTRTGEVTVSFFRAALVPIIPAEPKWSSMSHCGSDLQILDRDTGMMDITYSAAWHLGKAMGMADAAFVAALSRLRNSVHNISLDGAKRDKLTQSNAYKSKREVLQSLKESIVTLNSIQHPLDTGDSILPGSGSASFKTVATPLQKLAKPSVDLAVDDAIIREKSEQRAARHIRQLAGTKGKDGKVYKEGQIVYGELNRCVSPEWKIILGWIRDRMFLFGLPPQYLIADPSYAPAESIRFFHIDPNWVDAFLDGALSLGSHIERDDDYIRRCIKGAINAHLNTVDPATGYRPQIPSYGMLLRSSIVSRFPDLKVEAPIPADAPEPDRAPILRQEIIGDGLLLCLFDRVPLADDSMPVLSFTQPPHQQTFAFGDTLTPDALRIEYKRTYTVKKSSYDFEGRIVERRIHQRDEASGRPSGAEPPIFLWGEQGDARFILADIWASDVIDVLRNEMPSDFTDTHMTSAVAAFQLGTPIYRFVIGDTKSLDSLIPSEDALKKPRGLRLLEAMGSSGGQQLQRSMVTDTAFSLKVVGKKPAPFSIRDSGPFSFLFPAPPLRALPPHFCRPAHVHARAKAVRPPSPVSTIKRRQLTTGIKSEGATRASFGCSLGTIGGLQGQIQAGEHPQDLVFGVRRIDDATVPKNYWIKKISISVPRGPHMKNGSVQTLMDEYNGPGPVMLSNLRFNVLAENTDDRLILNIIPRSTTAEEKGVHADRVKECGFLLPLVDVHDARGVITIDYREDWAEPPQYFERSFTVNLMPS